MPDKIDLGDGEWAEVRTGREVTGEDRDEWLLAIDDARQEKGPAVQYKPNPENPAEMIEVPGDRSLSLRDQLKIRDMLTARLVTSWSFPQPYSRQARSQMSLAACKKLDAVIEAQAARFTDDGPDPKEATTPISVTTSRDAGETPQGEPVPE